MHYKNDSLVLFTSQFPYGNVSETFLETEILFLAKQFKKIFIVPSSSDNQYRALSANVEVITAYANITPSKGKKIKLLLQNLDVACSVLLTEAKDKGVGKCFKNRKVLLDYLAEQLVYKSAIEDFVLKQSPHTVFYDYWFCNRTLALTLLKRKHPTLKFVARAHGYDLYDERWGQIGVPFRSYKAKYLDRIYFISQNGFDYFKTKVKFSIEDKMCLARLGVISQQKEVDDFTNELPVIISISRVFPFKNINQIPTILSKLNSNVKWILFGDGPSMEEVIQEVKKLSDKIQVELKGHVENQEMIHFLRTNHVDLLLSLSSSEGLPVSMMEAQSFGIPIVATAVGGVPEIVIEGKTGFLIHDQKEALNQVQKALDYSFSAIEIKSFFNEHFNAKINYTNFAQSLCSLEN